MLFQTMCVPLLLFTALLGGSSACPLILEPYQEMDRNDIFLNCSIEADGHMGMYWSFNNRKLDEEPIQAFTQVSVPHSDRNATAKCTIKLNDTFDCSKYIQLNVYNSEKITETENNQHEFNCDVPEAKPGQNLTVKWYKEGTIIGPESTPKDMHSPLVLDISKAHEGATFACEALWHQDPLRQVYVSRNWSLSVEYAPKFEDKNETTVHVNKSAHITLACETTGNPPPDYMWLKNGSLLARTNNLTISQVNETTTYECKVSNRIGSDTRKFVVAVSPNEAKTTAAPKDSGCPVTITPKELFVKYGGSASANCSTTVDLDALGWEADKDGISRTEGVTSLVWTTANVETWIMKAECFVNFKNGHQCSEPLNITIYKLPDKVQVSPDGNRELVEGQEHKLQCDISNVAPVEKVQVKWYQDSQLLCDQTFNETAPIPQNKTSTLTLIPKKEQNKANFTCEIELLLGQGQNPKLVSAPYVANVQYKPIIQDCPPSYPGEEDEFKLEQVPCKPSGNPEPDTYWYYNNNLVNSTEPLTRKDSGTYTVIFKNNIGNTSTSVTITIGYQPLFSCETHQDVIEKTNLTLPCEPEGIPKPKSVWLKNGKQVDFSKQWKRHDSGEYSIVATNKYGRVNHTLSINVLYPPSLSENTTQEFDLGESLTLNCSADGNPLPQLDWKYPNAANVNMTTRGRQIYIAQATSTNAGLYVCNATNKFGSVTRTVTLIMKEKTHSHYSMIFIFVIITLLAIIILILVYRHHKKKSGSYSVIAISDSVPLTSR